MEDYDIDDVKDILSIGGDIDIDKLLSDVNKINIEEVKPPTDNVSMVSTGEIKRFLFELEADTSILRKKPRDLSGQEELFQLKVYDEIFVLPLFELANRINMKKNHNKIEFLGLDDLSITGRSMKIRDFLLTTGCTKKTFMQVVPQTEMEADILFAARLKSFDLSFQYNQTLDNNDRVLRAKQYLASLTNTSQENYGRSK